MNIGESYNELLKVLPNDDVLAQCMHCGMCLATCPTYEITKFERSSPRGRIKMIKSVARKEMEITPLFAEEMSFCLDCQACETACPAGVKYGSMVESARVLIEKSGQISFLKKILKNFGLKTILSSKRKLKIVAKLLYFYQNYGLQKFLHKSGLMKLLPFNLVEIDKLSPVISKKFSDEIINEIELPYGEEKFNTILLTGCIMNVAFADINIDTVEVLKNNNCKIISPKNQVCCGSLQAHNGDFDTAKKLAKENLKIFSNYKYDYIISNSAGCGAFMKEYAHLFEDDTELSIKAKELSSKVKDITEFLFENGNKNINNKLNESCTYHEACHLVHTQKISAQPKKVLNEISENKLAELEEATWCCGSAGIYNVVRYEDSMKFLERKMENIKKSGAKIVATGNPGCISQIRYGAKKFNVDVEVVHPVNLLKRGYDS